MCPHIVYRLAHLAMHIHYLSHHSITYTPFQHIITTCNTLSDPCLLSLLLVITAVSSITKFDYLHLYLNLISPCFPSDLLYLISRRLAYLS